MRHRWAPYLAAAGALILAAPADARTLTIRQPGAPEVTFTVPSGWRAQEDRHAVVLTRGRRDAVRIKQCPLWREQRDMTGRSAFPPSFGRGITALVPVRGGTCLELYGGDAAFARALRPALGRGGPAPASDAAAEQLARAARKLTLSKARAVGTALTTAFGYDLRIEHTFEYDLVARYQYHVMRFGNLAAEVVHTRDDDYARDGGEPCWGGTSPPEVDDTFEPRLELREWDAPPATKTAWQVAYQPIEPLPDGARRVRWTGFVADGEVVIGPDGLLRSVLIEDHHMARGRTEWRTVAIAFTGFPATLTPVRPEPECP